MATRSPFSRRSAVADVRLLSAGLDAVAELERFTKAHPDAGAIASFLGQVRGGEAVEALELQHYAPLTLTGMEALAAALHRRWPLSGLLILHRIGRMAPGEAIVLVAAASRHRRAALEAIDCAMDHLKSRAWFWKRELTAQGWRWIEPREEDHADLARWDLA